MKKILLSVMAFCSATSFSQNLDFNTVRAGTGSNGLLFLDANTLGPSYEVPSGSGNHTIFSAGLWCAAIDDTGGLHVAAARFNQNGQDYFQGPFSSSNSYQDAAYQAAYGTSTWTISKAEIQSHISGYTQPGYIPAANIASWPGNGVGGLGIAQNLAPFVDVNNNGVYEPLLGDYPDIRGDQAVYKIMNDAADLHTETGGLPLGIEVHTMYYQYASTDYLDSTTFLNIRVFNRGIIDYDHFKLAVYADLDLGNPGDDFIGCDSIQNLMYVYNGDNNDQNSGNSFGYGIDPPAFGIASLNQDMEHFAFFSNSNSFPFTDPVTAPQYYYLMNGMWANGAPWMHNGSEVNFIYPGNPNDANAWSEVTDQNIVGDRRGVFTMADENLPIGAHTCYDFAFLFARNANSNYLENVDALINQAAQAKSDFDAMTSYNCNQVTLGIDEAGREVSVELFPNPSNGIITLSFGETLFSGVVTVMDIHGRIVHTEKIANQNVKKMNMYTKPGLYHVSIASDGSTISTVNKKIIILE